jgi:DNA processing protein
MSLGVLVVESARRGGSLHTADAALEQGRTVFAVPGRIDSPASQGTHQLIKNGACLVDTLDDILHEFAFCAAGAQQELGLEEPALRPDLPVSGDEETLIKALWDGGLNVDELTVRAGLPVQRINALLLGLEMKRLIKMLPGRQVELRDEVWSMNG